MDARLADQHTVPVPDALQQSGVRQLTSECDQHPSSKVAFREIRPVHLVITPSTRLIHTDEVNAVPYGRLFPHRSSAMKIAVRRSPSLATASAQITNSRSGAFMPTALTLALCATFAPFSVSAGTVVGGSKTINPGDPIETWSVTDGELIVSNGATTDAIDASLSRVIASGATIENTGTHNAIALQDSQAVIDGTVIRSVNGSGIYVRHGSIGTGSSLTLSNSSILASSVGVSAGPFAEVLISNSQITTTAATSFLDAAIRSQGASVTVSNGSTIRGGHSGFSFFLANTSADENGTLLVDASTVEGVVGSAVHVSSGSTGSLTTAASILVRNGGQLKGGNGNILTVEKGLADFLPTANLAVESSTLSGNVVALDGATANVTLRNGGRINGTFNAVNRTLVDDGGYWQLTGSSTVASLEVLGSGTVALGDGSTFNTLDVAGNFTGNDGMILFNTVLAGDNAATDKLIIGGDTSGSANVRVNNIGGAGAQTDKGIELIQVGGASNGQFNLAGRAVGGQYDYFLFKGTGTDGNWYLRSQLPTQPEPCEVDPTLPECNPVNPEPVLRPEPGAYLANLQAAQTMFRLGYHDRQAGQNGGRAWARVDGSRNGFDAVSRQLDIRGNSQALTVGADVWRHDSGSSVGVMLSTGNATSTSTNELTGYYARGKVKGEALGLYGTLRAGNGADPYAGFYLDGSLQRAQFRNRVEGIGLADERYDSRAWQGAVETGYAFRVGGASNGGIYLEPQLQVGYNRWDNARHTEVNGTVVTAENANGMFGRAGVRLSGVTRWGNGAAEVQPYLAANWLHTRSESQIRMDDEVVDARIPRNRGEFSGGASVKFGNGIGAWGGLSLQKASGYHQTSAQVGVSYSW